MGSEQRLQRLRELLDQIERLPASAERERMLREIRGRVVDVDTGVSPRALLPVDAGSAPAVDPRPPAVRIPRRRPRAVPRPEPARPVEVASLGANEILSLNDVAPFQQRRAAHPELPAGPWRRGLRG